MDDARNSDKTHNTYEATNEAEMQKIIKKNIYQQEKKSKKQ